MPYCGNKRLSVVSDVNKPATVLANGRMRGDGSVALNQFTALIDVRVSIDVGDLSTSS